MPAQLKPTFLLAPALLVAGFLLLLVAAIFWKVLPQEEVWSTWQQPLVTEALRLSGLTSALSLILALVFGTPMAYLLARRRFPGAAVLDTLIDLPMVLPPQVRRIGYVPQRYALFPHLSVAHNIGFGLQLLPRKEQTRRIGELVELFSLQSLERRRPHELSGGQQQRVALARAVAVRPWLLLLDEPFAALDTPLRTALRWELLQLAERLALKIFLVSHDLADAFALGQQVLVYENGHMIQQGAREAIFFRPRQRV